jgi:hypothetical protein
MDVLYFGLGSTRTLSYLFLYMTLNYVHVFTSENLENGIML